MRPAKTDCILAISIKSNVDKKQNKKIYLKVITEAKYT